MVRLLRYGFSVGSTGVNATLSRLVARCQRYVVQSLRPCDVVAPSQSAKTPTVSEPELSPCTNAEDDWNYYRSVTGTCEVGQCRPGSVLPSLALMFLSLVYEPHRRILLLNPQCWSPSRARGLGGKELSVRNIVPSLTVPV